MTENLRIAVILAAHGEAETTRFLENYRVNMHTLGHASRVMPIPLPLQRLISVTSSFRKRVRSLTNSLASPHNSLTREQADALGRRLGVLSVQSRFSFDVHAAFSASEPSLESVLEKTREYDAEVIVSMSPIDSTLSCGLICGHLASTRSPRELCRVRVLSRFWDDGGLYPVFIDHLLENAAARHVRKEDGRVLMLMYHGTLVSDAKGGEPVFRTGLDGTMTFSRRLSKMIGEHPANPYAKIMTAFLNHDVGGIWTSPSFEDVCRQLSRDACAGADLFACGYFVDGNETIHRASELSRSSPLRDVSTIPCLNASPAFTEYLATKVLAAVRQIEGTGEWGVESGRY
jgi:ferrochelatase